MSGYRVDPATGAVRKLVLWRRTDQVAKGDEDDGGEPTFTRAELDRLCAEAEADPEIRELVAETMASARLGKGAERVEVRKESSPMPSAAELRERISALEDRIAVTKAETVTLRANRQADEVLALCERGRRGDREAVAKAGELLGDRPTYDAYQARVRGERYVHPVEKKAAEPDHRGAIRELVAKRDTKGLGELLDRDPAAHRQYREMRDAGELAPAGKAA